MLIVIDEAHNVCPAAPPDRLVALATEHAVRISEEGGSDVPATWARPR